MLASTADASTISAANVNIGAVLTTHTDRIFRDGLPSACGNPDHDIPQTFATGTQFKFAVFHFDSRVREPVCVHASLSTACAGNDAVMSTSYSPSFSPGNLVANWVGDMGNVTPTQTSYGFTVPPLAHFVTVVDQGSSTGNCAAVSINWTSDRPWATRLPEVHGVPAVGQTLSSPVDAWAGDPTVGRQWRRCDLAGANCSDIPGAIAVGYKITDADVGHTITVRESATEAGLTSTSDATATTEVFIPLETHDGRLLSGDTSESGSIGGTGAPSRCGTPTPFPGVMDFNDHFFDTFAITSLVNEPACIWVARQEGCLGNLVVYTPRFVPTDIARNFTASDDGTGTVSYTLAPGASAEATIVESGTFHLCGVYSLVIGSDAPFATAPPQVSAPPAEGVALTTTNGTWTGAPTFAQAWLRCSADGSGCAPIGADGPAYTPVADDVGHTLRSRITATEGKSQSADSAPSAVVVAKAAGTGPGGGAAPGQVDRTAPKAKLALARTTLQKVLKSGFLRVTVTCDEACAISLRADVTRKLGKRLGGVKIAAGKGSLRAGRKTTVKVKLTRKARRALRRSRSVAFTLKATATDAAGNSSKATRKARVRRGR